MPELLLNPIFIVFSLLLIVGIYYIVSLSKTVKEREEQIIELQGLYNQMQRSFNDLDEQAKLIVKTDLELNKAQEELDKRLNGLNALQRTSRQIAQAMNENQVFDKLNKETFEELGYSKMLVVVNDDGNHPRPRSWAGYENSKLDQLIQSIFQEVSLKSALDQGLTLSTMNASRKAKESLQQILGIHSGILAPIISQAGLLGFIFVGNPQEGLSITQADEELIAILAGQIGQSMENSKLFDKVFRSSQELEVKVKERTKQLAFALSQVEEINRKKTEFISAVSHELRTPLTSIKGYAAILLAGKIGDIPTAVKDRLAKINLHSDNLVNLINNLLDIARIESGRVDMRFETHKIDAVLDEISDLLTPQFSAKDVHLIKNLHPSAKEIYIDKPQAERVFINLLSNAVKFTPKGGTITINMLPEIDKGFVTFQVTDSGIGISPEDIEKLFTEFFRVENEINQHVKGTGLGLVLAKQIVAAHHGRIWVTSKVGVGTTFSFTLPIDQESFDKWKKSTVVVP